MRIVVGLGNYGDRYAHTYHNMGFLCAECLSDKLGFKFKKRECESLIAEGFIKGEKVIIAKPLTYMNLSGVAVKQLLKKNKADINDLIVVYDDIDLPIAKIRVRPSGSAGTHNGMRNIIDEIGSQEFKRVRIGVGKPPEFMNLADYVLSEVSKEYKKDVFEAIDNAAEEILKLL